MESIFIVDHSSKLGGGQLGIVRYLKNKTRTLKVTLILFEEGSFADTARQCDNCEVIVIDSKKILSKILQINKIFGSNNQSLILANSLPAFLYCSLAWSARNRVIKYLRQEAYPHNASRAKKIFLKYFAYPNARGFLANSDFTKSSLSNRRLVDCCQVTYTISGIEKSVERESLDFSNPVHILSLSRLTPWKGVHNIVKAVIDANTALGEDKFSLTVAGGSLFGETDYEESLHNLAKGKDYIKFTGNVSDVSGLLDTHDILVSGSVLPEPFGQIIVQGISHGLLTIATNQGGAKEILSHLETGILVEPDNPAKLSEILLWALENPEEVSRIREKGMERSADFLDNSMVSLLEQKIKQF